ncbi:MAG: lysylphosphatidylglycerol synthase domain-containing protein [Actinomycetota bacterium]
MTYGLPDKEGARRRRLPRWAVIAAALLTIPVIWLIAATVDVGSLEAVWETVTERPAGLALALAAFAVAFGLRSLAWTRVLPDLGLRHSWAALHVSLGGNHVLPLRLGEPLRVVSVVRRAGIDWQRATASTVTLRAADLLAIGVIGAVAGLGALTAWWATAGIVLLGAVLVAAGVVWLTRLREEGKVSLPGPVAITATIAAWALESVVVYEAARWAGVELTFAGAILVTAAAVVSQVAAFAPGGLGTYEAGGVAAIVFLGVEPAVGLAVVLTAHAVKTAYSLALGLVAVFVPSPGIFGRLRLQHAHASGEKPRVGERVGPIVLFMPAFNEASTVGRVVSRVPDRVGEHPVVCLVVDDGSTDDTAPVAEAAGATVIRQGENQGLGAAVRTGMEESLRYEPVAVAFCDADGEYAPEELDVMVRPIIDGRADYVVGSRFAGDIERMLPHRRVGNLILTWLLSWVARHRISDGQSGYRAFSPRAAERAEIIHDFNYAQVLTLDLLAKGMKYAEVPITYTFRTTGESFVKLGRYLRAVVPAVYREVNAETY